jgi:hypothetical protein
MLTAPSTHAAQTRRPGPPQQDRISGNDGANLIEHGQSRVGIQQLECRVA